MLALECVLVVKCVEIILAIFILKELPTSKKLCQNHSTEVTRSKEQAHYTF